MPRKTAAAHKCSARRFLGLAFVLRAVGDASSGTLSPLGWSLQVRPYAGDRWWVLLLHLGRPSC